MATAAKKGDIYDKMFSIQAQIPAIQKDSTNPFFKSKYFDINRLLAALKPALEEHRLLLMQPLSHLDGAPAIHTIIYDLDSGETVETITPMPVNIDPQKMGSTITYYRRYALQSLFSLQAVDDDANLGAQPPGEDPTITKIHAVIKKITDPAEIANYTERIALHYSKNVEKTIEALPLNVLPAVLSALDAKVV